MSTARGYFPSRVIGGFCAIAYVAYVAQLHPDVDWGDSGELITAAHLLAPAHFLGYPLYVIPAKLIGLVPLGPIALRVAWFSALLGSATLVVLMAAVTAWMQRTDEGEGKDRIGRVSPYLLWALAGLTSAVAFSPAFLGQSTRAENTMPALLLLSLGLYCVRGSETVRRAGLAIFSLLAAFHPALLPISVLGGLVITAGSPRGHRLKAFLRYGILQVVLLSVNLFLPLRSPKSLPLSYAFGRTPSEWLSTLQTGFRKYYGSDLVSVVAAERATDALGSLLPQFAVVATPLALFGLYRLVRRRLSLSALVIPMLTVFTALALLNPSQEREGYSLLMVVVLLWLSGVGLLSAASLRWRRGAAVVVVLLGGMGWISTSTQLYRLGERGIAQSPVARRLGEEILTEMGGHAVYIAANERLALVTEYLKFVERRRPDVALAFLPIFFTDGAARRVEEMYPHLRPPLVRVPAGQFSCALPLSDVYVSQLVERNKGRFPIYTDTHAPWSFPSRLDARTMSAFVRTGVRDFREYIQLAAEGLNEANLRYRFVPSLAAGEMRMRRHGVLYSFGAQPAPLVKDKLLRIWEVENGSPTDEEVLTLTLYQWAAYDFAEGRLGEAVLGYRMAAASYRRAT